MEKEQFSGSHLISLENRAQLRVTGVLDVDRFEERQIVVLTNMGVLTVEGEDLRINQLSVEAGDLLIEGQIDRLLYTDLKGKSGGLLKSLFR